VPGTCLDQIRRQVLAERESAMPLSLRERQLALLVARWSWCGSGSDSKPRPQRQRVKRPRRPRRRHQGAGEVQRLDAGLHQAAHAPALRRVSEPSCKSPLRCVGCVLCLQ